MTFKCLAMLAACQLLCSEMWSQRTTDSNATLSHTAAAQLYSSIINEHQQLYNGREYIWSYPKSTGHPFYISDGFQQGSIEYDGVTYYDVPMQYELAKGVLIIKGANDARIELATDNVSAFSIGNNFFRKMKHSGLPGVYYQQLYDLSGIELIAERKKNLERGGNAEDLDVFKPSDSYYIGRGDQYYKIGEPTDLYKLFTDKEKLLKNFVRNSKLNFRKDPETFLLRLVAYYNSIQQ